MLPEWYFNYKSFIETSLNRYLEIYFSDEKNIALNSIKESCFYAVKNGKRIRAILALEFYILISWKTFDNIKQEDDILKFCIALELLHAYSLVHDDLPCMDNDEYRRWELTVWKKYGETIATLCGDILNSLSFEILWEIWNTTLVKVFWEAVWIKWMLGWQVLDLFYEQYPEKLTFESLLEVHNKKTWALIQVAVFWWLLLGNLSLWKEQKHKKEDLKEYIEYGKKIWLAFQIKDDILDVEWSLQETWKSVGWEQKGFVYFLGIEKSKQYLNDIKNESLQIIKNLWSQKLEFLTQYIAERKK